MEVYSETNWHFMNLIMEKRAVLQTLVDSLGDGHRNSIEVTAPRREAEHRLEELEKAFTRMEAGRYGICETCATGIAPDRLEALPETRFCRDCAGSRSTRGDPVV